jgi:hypothetical protein
MDHSHLQGAKTFEHICCVLRKLSAVYGKLYRSDSVSVYVHSWNTHQAAKSWISVPLQTEEKSAITRCLDKTFYKMFDVLAS